MKFSSRKQLLLSADAELNRMRKLAGITESKRQISEAPSSQSMNKTFKYFKEIKIAINTLCDEVLSALNASKLDPTNEDAQYAVIESFETYGGELTDIDSSFEDWYEYWLNGRSDDFPSQKNFPIENPKKFASKIPGNIKYFQNLRKSMNTLCDDVLKSLSQLKSKGSAATSRDISLPKAMFEKNIELVVNMDSSFERWETWCLERGRIFKF